MDHQDVNFGRLELIVIAPRTHTRVLMQTSVGIIHRLGLYEYTNYHSGYHVVQPIAQ